MPQTTGILYIDSGKALKAAAEKLKQTVPEPRAVDTETTGDRPFVDRLKVIQIAVKDLPVYVIQIERIPETDWKPLREYLAESCPNILQNAQFDLKMLAAEGFCLAGEIKDTFLESRILHLGKRNISHNLGSLVLEWLGIPLDKDEQKSFLGDESRAPLTVKQIQYCAGDVIHLRAVTTKLEQKIQERAQQYPQILKRVRREEAFVRSLAKIELTGFKLSPAIDQFKKTIEQELATIEPQLTALVRPHLNQIRLNLSSEFFPVKLTHEEVCAAFDLDSHSTENVLRELLKKPQLRLVLQHRLLIKQLETCKKIKKLESPTTQRIHPQYNQIERLSGQLNLKTKIGLLERLTGQSTLVTSAEGKSLVRISLPDIELRLLTHYSKEPDLLEEFRQGVSPTETVRQSLTELGIGDSTNRVTQALWHSYGILYKKGCFLQRYLYSEWGLIFNLKETKQMQTVIDELYPQLPQFHTAIKNWKYENRATILGTLRCWDRTTDADIRDFLIWTSVSELLKEAVIALETLLDKDEQVVLIRNSDLLVECSDSSNGRLEAFKQEVQKQLRKALIGIAVKAEKNC